MSTSVNRALSLLPLTVLNASLVAKGLSPEPLKANAITTVETLINQGVLTLDDVRVSAPNSVSRVASSNATIPDDVRNQLVTASADVNKAIAEVNAIRETLTVCLTKLLRSVPRMKSGFRN